MESSELRDLLEFLAKSNFVEFEMEREGFRLRLLRSAALPAGAASNGSAPAGGAETAPAPGHPAPAAALAGSPEAAGGSVFVVTSPIVGTFYRSSSPEVSSFVEVGGRVKKGQVLCIVEAMKLMNEIESEVEGEILEILVANGQPVEYGETLFRIRPAS